MSPSASLLVAVLLGAVAVLIVSGLVPGFRVRGFGTALVVAVVYGLLKALLQWVLILLALPVVLVTLGLFVVVINAFLLWITNRLVPGFEVRSKGALLLGTLLLSLIDVLFQLVLRHPSVF